MKQFKNYEDIYPLTIITMRFSGGGKYVAFNAPEDSGYVQEVNTEEISYRLKEWLEENVLFPYGVGNTIWEALDNLIEMSKDK